MPTQTTIVFVKRQHARDIEEVPIDVLPEWAKTAIESGRLAVLSGDTYANDKDRLKDV